MVKRPQLDFTVLPAIDLRGGQVVRLSQGDFGRETQYGDDPVAIARAFVAAGARWLHIVDLEGARYGEPRQASGVAQIVEAVGDSARCEVAGGLRDEAAVAAAFDAGAARVVLGTSALKDYTFAGRLVERYGEDAIVVALDVRDGHAVTSGWLPGARGTPVGAAMTGLHAEGVQLFEVTAVLRDGMLTGPDLGLLQRIVQAECGDVIASGGITSIADLIVTRDMGCAGAIVGRAFYEGQIDLAKALRAVQV